MNSYIDYHIMCGVAADYEIHTEWTSKTTGKQAWGGPPKVPVIAALDSELKVKVSGSLYMSLCECIYYIFSPPAG